MDDDDRFEDDFAARERTSLAPMGFTEGERAKNPEDKFKLVTEAVVNSLSPAYIARDSIGDLFMNADKLAHIKFKNPTAYVLGYIASNGGTGFNIASVNKAYKAVGAVQDRSVLPPDIIRYGRLWQRLITQ